MAFLKADKVLMNIFFKYLDYVNVFSANFAIKLLEYNGINNDTIELKKGKQSSYKLIYSLNPVELETLKTYIETQPKTRFI